MGLGPYVGAMLTQGFRIPMDTPNSFSPNNLAKLFTIQDVNVPDSSDSSTGESWPLATLQEVNTTCCTRPTPFNSS